MTAAAIKSILVGVGGSLILAAFFTTFLTTAKVLVIMPLFIAFNGALTGYRLVEKMKTTIDNIPLFSFILGIGCGALTFIALKSLGTLMKNGFYLSAWDLVIYMIVSGVTSYLGARLAVRYFNLN